MSEQNLEQRVAYLEKKQKELIAFSIDLLRKIHQLDKNMGSNFSQLALAIKEPDRFDVEDYQSQIARHQFKQDQADAMFDDILPKTPPGNEPPKG